jgi:hypothetical protein
VAKKCNPVPCVLCACILSDFFIAAVCCAGRSIGSAATAQLGLGRARVSCEIRKGPLRFTGPSARPPLFPGLLGLRPLLLGVARTSTGPCQREY